MGGRVGAVTGGVVLLFLVVNSGGGINPIQPASPSVAVSECRTITTPGHYELTANLSAAGPENCVHILANDVVLDGNGYVIRSVGPTRSLVRAQNASNVTVTSLTTVGSTAGISFQNVTRGRIENVTAASTARMGIWVVDSAGIEVDRATVTWNAFSGIRFDHTTESVVSRSKATDNAAGLALGRSRGIVVRDSEFNRNQIGIELAGAVDNTLARNTLVGNDFGMVLAVSTGNSIVNNSFRRNTDGIRLDEADGNRILRNRLTDHAFGLYLNGASGNSLRENVIERAGVGIELTFSSDGNTVARNRVRARQAGIRQTASGGNILVENAVTVVGTGTGPGSTPTQPRAGRTTSASVPGSAEQPGPVPTERGFGPELAGLAVLAVIGGAIAWHRFRPPGG